MKAFWPLVSNDVFNEDGRKAMHEVIDGDQHTMANRVREFEINFARYHGKKWAVMTNSGSSANLLAVAALKQAPTAKNMSVLVPAIAWATTYAPFHQYGYRLIVCDVEPDTFGMDLSEADAGIESDTDVLCIASILGTPANLADALEFVRIKGLMLFEDNCESLGAQTAGQLCGTFGDISTFSFFYTHHLGIGEGGMLLTDNDWLYDLAVCMRAHGWTRDLRAGSMLWPLQNDWEIIPGRYEFIMPGYNVRPTEIQAAAAQVQLDRLYSMNTQRVFNYEHFVRKFDLDDRWTIQKHVVGDYSVPFAFCIVFASSRLRRDALFILKEHGIESRMITGGSFAAHPVEQFYDWRYATMNGTPVADRIHNCGLFLGNHATDLTQQILTTYDLLNKGLK